MTRPKRWLKYGFVAVISLTFTLAVAGVTYQAVSNWRDQRRFQPEGKLVDVGGYRLHIFCAGEGSPAVILESGLGVPGIGWMLVEQEAARFTRVCYYDRAGYGFSDPGPEPRTSLQIARELHALLEKTPVPAPYVLVGHSLGGFNARVFTGQYPREVAGMVLVDSSHEDQQSRLPPWLKAENDPGKWLPVLAPWALRLGVLRLIYRLGNPRAMNKLPPAVREEVAFEMLQEKFLHATFDELHEFAGADAAEVRASGDLGDRPLIVLTAAKPVNPKPDTLAFHRIWINELQPSLARLSTRGRRVMVEDSDHMIPLEDPGAVVRAIRDVVDQCRSH